MMKQDSEEAKGNVGKRIDFINSELSVLFSTPLFSLCA